MSSHLFKLIWRRKGANALLILEIAISFLVVFAVCLGSLYYLTNARHPLGFDGEGLWTVEISRGGGRVDGAADAEELDVTRRILAEALQLPEVESAALIENAPYEMSESNTVQTINGRDVWMENVLASDELADTLRLNLVQGRWFDASDQGRHWSPAVINAQLAQEVFGDADPIGGVISDDDHERESRVVGVVDAFRRKGELSRPANFVFWRQPSDPAATIPLRNLMVRLQPGISRGWEPELVKRLEAVAPGVSIRVRTLAELKTLSDRFALIPLAIGAVLAGFLLLMVVLGLLGVLWQNVTRRRREIGLRRALGADAQAIHGQLMGELFVLVLFGLAVGSLVIAQLPLIGLPSTVGEDVFVGSALAAALLTFVLAALAGLHPSRLATRITPAEALHHD